MEFNLKYSTEFYDYSKMIPEGQAIVKSDFIRGLTEELMGIGYSEEHGWFIANSVCGQMTNPSLHYHTACHVLGIFQFAQEHNITLSNEEAFAIWFHDAIYFTSSKPRDNERASAMFFQSMTYPKFTTAETMKIVNLIEATALHCEDKVATRYHLLLDLDLFNFSMPPEICKLSTDLVAKEYADIPPEDYAKGRKAFMQKLLSKGYVYRTEYFKQFEKQARENIEAIINN